MSVEFGNQHMAPLMILKSVFAIVQQKAAEDQIEAVTVERS